LGHSPTCTNGRTFFVAVFVPRDEAARSVLLSRELRLLDEAVDDAGRDFDAQVELRLDLDAERTHLLCVAGKLLGGGREELGELLIRADGQGLFAARLRVVVQCGRRRVLTDPLHRNSPRFEHIERGRKSVAAQSDEIQLVKHRLQRRCPACIDAGKVHAPNDAGHRTARFSDDICDLPAGHSRRGVSIQLLDQGADSRGFCDDCELLLLSAQQRVARIVRYRNRCREAVIRSEDWSDLPQALDLDTVDLRHDRLVAGDGDRFRGPGRLGILRLRRHQRCRRRDPDCKLRELADCRSQCVQRSDIH
jgi:hypothetical protein